MTQNDNDVSIMNKYIMVITSFVYGPSEGSTVSIQVIVNSPMTAEQLRTFYLCSHSKVSDVYVEALTLPELA